MSNFQPPEASTGMEDKRVDLKSEQQRVLLQTLVEQLGRENPQLYYQSTMQIAYALEGYIKKGARLTQDERELLAPLKPKDMQIILGLQ
ncbi:MAG: hypothetical protein AAFR51_14995 [Pseudomonadota bacterium]